MASSEFKNFSALDASDVLYYNKEILCRLIHFWEARHYKQGNILMGFELLLIDSEANTILAFISANRLFRYEDDLKPNSVYRLSKFMVKPSKPVYKTNNHKQRILFTDQTTFVEVTGEGDNNIAQQKFRVRPFSDFSAIVDTETDLFDVLGRIRHVSGDNFRQHSLEGLAVQPLDVTGADRVYLHLLMTDGETVRVNLWGNFAEQFRERWNKASVDTKSLLITTLNPRTIGGAVALGSTSSTRVFIDSDLPETEEFMTRSISAIATPSSAITKLKTVTIRELNDFVQSKPPQIASFYCIATIVDVLGQYGWNYISCSGSGCKTMLGKTETSMYCTSCKKNNSIGLLRYRFEATVRDENKDQATFVIFDDDGLKLTGRLASDLLALSDRNRDRRNATVPACIQTTIGRTCKFQVQLKPYNFCAFRQTFTVSRIVDDAAAVNQVTEKLCVPDGEELYRIAKQNDKRERQPSGDDDSGGKTVDIIGGPTDKSEGKRPRTEE